MAWSVAQSAWLGQQRPSGSRGLTLVGSPPQTGSRVSSSTTAPPRTCRGTVSEAAAYAIGSSRSLVCHASGAVLLQGQQLAS